MKPLNTSTGSRSLLPAYLCYDGEIAGFSARLEMSTGTCIRIIFVMANEDHTVASN